jgi:hypothetical protein
MSEGVSGDRVAQFVPTCSDMYTLSRSQIFKIVISLRKGRGACRGGLFGDKSVFYLLIAGVCIFEFVGDKNSLYCVALDVILLKLRIQFSG